MSCRHRRNHYHSTDPICGRLWRTTFENAKLAAPGCRRREPRVDALLGLAAFRPNRWWRCRCQKRGLDHDQLWERKRQVIEQAPGLTVWRGGEGFTDVGGCANVKAFLQSVLDGAEAPRVRGLLR